MKKTIYYLVIISLFLGGLSGGLGGLKAEEASSVIITEIGAYELSNHEWIVLKTHSN